MRHKCKACGVELVKGESMPQTIEQWQYMQALTENAMLRDRDEISRLKRQINKLEQKRVL